VGGVSNPTISRHVCAEKKRGENSNEFFKRMSEGRGGETEIGGFFKYKV